MKKLMKQVFAIAALLLLQSPVYSQVYVAPTFGYGWQANKTQVAVDDVAMSTTGWNNVKATYASLGGGLNAGLGVGYEFPNGLIAEFGFNHLFPSHVESSARDTMFGNDFTLTRIYSVTRTNLAPTIGYQFKSGRLQFYTKTSLLIGIGIKANCTIKTLDEYSSPSRTYESNTLQHGRISFGMSQRIGVGYIINEHWTTSLEFTGVFQNWSPKFGEVTKSESQGVSTMSGAEYSSTHFVYVESMIQPNPNAPTDERSERIKPLYSLSSIGFSFSVAYSFDIARK